VGHQFVHALFHIMGLRIEIIQEFISTKAGASR
jgi:hypothetical protein